MFAGTVMIGLFSTENGLFHGGGFLQLGKQLAGVAIVGAVVLGLALVTFTLLKKTVGLRVDEHMEVNGLDTIEHGISAYMDL
jgi:Amt family ammonium transporter